MSIGRRLINLARTELNSLLDKAAEVGADDRDPDEDLYRRYGLAKLTDAELEAEIERRRRARETAAHPAREAPPAPGGTGAKPRPGARPSQERAAPRPPSSGDEIRRAYAALEVPQGSDFQVVRKAYRTLMRKYHPDRHTQAPEKQKAANELAQRLTAAYDLLEKNLRR